MYTRSNRVEYRIRRMLGRLSMILNRRRFYIYFDKKQRKIIVSERYEKRVRIVSRIVLLLSVVTAFLAIPPPLSIFISLGLIIVEQLLERVIYSFQSLALIPFPDFATWKRANFLALLFAKDGPTSPHNVGMVFENTENARKVWGFIEDWNYGRDDDRESNNISVSIVVNKRKDAYAVFVYPSHQRPSIKAAEKELKRGKEGKEQMLGLGLMIMCKVFPLQNSSFNRIFRPHYNLGEDYAFSSWAIGDPPERIDGTLAIMKNQLKIIDAEDLTRKDIEYHMVKYTIDWDNPDPNKPSVLYTKKF